MAVRGVYKVYTPSLTYLECINQTPKGRDSAMWFIQIIFYATYAENSISMQS